MPPSNIQGLGWKFFFGLLAFLQVIAIGVLWRTYDTVSEANKLTALHDYQINNVILPDIRELKTEKKADAKRSVVRSD